MGPLVQRTYRLDVMIEVSPEYRVSSSDPDWIVLVDEDHLEETERSGETIQTEHVARQLLEILQRVKYLGDDYGEWVVASVEPIPCEDTSISVPEGALGTPRDCCGCGAVEDEEHDEDCGHAQCAISGQQLIQCCRSEHPRQVCRPTVWTGLSTDERTALEQDWWAVCRPGEGWVPCTRETPGARLDSNRVLLNCEWDSASQRWVPLSGS